jgi:hypothetical protein
MRLPLNKLDASMSFPEPLDKSPLSPMENIDGSSVILSRMSNL